MDRTPNATESIAPRRRETPSSPAPRLTVLASLPDLRSSSPIPKPRPAQSAETTAIASPPASQAAAPPVSETQPAPAETTLRSRRAERNQRRGNSGGNWRNLGIMLGFAVVGLGFCLVGYIAISSVFGRPDVPELADSWGEDLKPPREPDSLNIEIGTELTPYTPPSPSAPVEVADRRAAEPTERPWVGLAPRDGETSTPPIAQEDAAYREALKRAAVPTDNFGPYEEYEYPTTDGGSRPSGGSEAATISDEDSPLDEYGYPRTNSPGNGASGSSGSPYEAYNYPHTSNTHSADARNSETRDADRFQPTSSGGQHPQVREYNFNPPAQGSPSFEINDQGSYPTTDAGGAQFNP